MAFSFAGTILSSYKYAWSDKVGYINFENVLVDNTTLSGYAWSKNTGWINMSPDNGGVSNDSSGNLSGYAWGEGLGWIDFGGVSVSTATGKFSGVATGTLVGSINFDCPNYCDVRTDWRPVSECASWTYSDWGSCSGGQQTRSILSSIPSGCSGGSPVLSQSCGSSGGGGGGLGLFLINSFKPISLDSFNTPLIIEPEQSGNYTKDTEVGPILLKVSKNSVIDKTTFYINENFVNKDSQKLISEEVSLVNGTFYDIYAKNQFGEYVHNFDIPITISLPIPANLQNNPNLAVYWLNEVNKSWVLIPSVVFTNGKVTFQVNHLTRFAIFDSSIDKQNDLVSVVVPKISIPVVGVTDREIINLSKNVEEEKNEVINKNSTTSQKTSLKNQPRVVSNYLNTQRLTILILLIIALVFLLYIGFKNKY